MIRIPLKNRDRQIVAFALIDDCDSRLAFSTWHRSKKGYVVRMVRKTGDREKRRMLYLHREVLKTSFPQVDHINGNRLDCRRSNLRPATNRLNTQNRGANSGRNLPKGVRFRRDIGKFEAFGKKDGKFIYLGCHADLEDATEKAREWRAENLPWSPEAREGATV